MGNQVAKSKEKVTKRAKDLETKMDKVETLFESADGVIESRLAGLTADLIKEENEVISKMTILFNQLRKPFHADESQARLSLVELKKISPLAKQFNTLRAGADERATTGATSKMIHPSLCDLHRRIIYMFSQSGNTFTVPFILLPRLQLKDFIQFGKEKDNIPWVSIGFPHIQRNPNSISLSGAVKETDITSGYGICINPINGDIYISGTSGGVDRYDSDMRFITSFRTVNRNIQMTSGRGIDVSLTGKVAVASNGDSLVYFLNPDLSVIKVVGQSQDKEEKLYYPQSISFDINENLFVCDGANRRIVKYSPNGEFLMQFPVERGSNEDSFEGWSWGLVVNHSNEVIVSPQSQNYIHVYSTEGKIIRKIPFDRTTTHDYINRGPNGGFVYTSQSQKKILFYNYKDEKIYELPRNGISSCVFGLSGEFYVCNTTAKKLQSY